MIEIDTLLANRESYDLIIDARSPGEYAHSHLPGAVNFYALDDTQHHEVGTLYKQVSPFEARVRGASYVCLNAAEHIKAIYPAYTPRSKIAIYCARGGMRSSSLGTIFSSIGYPIDRVAGGYKAYRTYVCAYLEEIPPLSMLVLGGHTGCGKSELLRMLDNVIDLEAMANHYGSVFGAVNGEQPSPKAFENTLVDTLTGLDRHRAVFVEAESKRIGRIVLPGGLYAQMEEGFRIEITAPLEQRMERIVAMYAHMDEDYFLRCMERITPYIRKSDKEEAIRAYHGGELSKVAEILLTQYYDTVYKKTAKADMTLVNDNPVKTAETLRALQQEKRR